MVWLEESVSWSCSNCMESATLEETHTSPRLLANILSHGKTEVWTTLFYILMAASIFITTFIKRRGVYLCEVIYLVQERLTVLHQNTCCIHIEVNSYGLKMSDLRKKINFKTKFLYFRVLKFYILAKNCGKIKILAKLINYFRSFCIVN